MGISLREATLQDIDWMLVQLKLFAEFYQSSHSLFSDDDGFNRNLLKQIIEGHYFLVSENDGKVSGFIAGMISPHLFNPKIKTFTELFFWVLPEYRGTRAGSALLNAFVEFGKDYHWTVMTLEHNSPIKDESLLKRGFKYKEQSFIKEGGLSGS